MRILFGIQGTGNGHISRCRSLALALAAKNVDVDYIFSGRPKEQYFDMQAFGNYRTLRGISFATKDGKISAVQTLKDIKAFRLLKDVKELDLSSYDRIISDFEPVSAWAARQQKIECLGISNQASFAYLHPEGTGLLNNTIMKYYAPVTKAVGIYWFHFGHPIVPPIVEKLAPTNNNNCIVIYLPFESLDILKQIAVAFPQQQFICYHQNISANTTYKNITYCQLSHDKFKEDLKACSGIITNAGFSLISEALVLGKKILAKPLIGQFEQMDNINCLKQLGLAYSMDEIDLTKIEKWLVKPNAQPVVYPDVAAGLADWIVSGEKQPILKLSQQLWEQVIFPPSVAERIHALGWDKLTSTT